MGYISLSKQAIESMGYNEYPETDIIKAGFRVIRVYSLQGVVFERGSEFKNSEVTVLSDRCTVVIADSINEASKLISGEEFVEDEDKWISDRKASSPFLVIYFKENELREMNGGYRQESDGNIRTFDAFADEKNEILKWEEEVLPGIVTSLTVNLSSPNCKVKLDFVERFVFGITQDGVKVINSKMTGSGYGYVSHPRSTDQINTSLSDSVELSSVLTKDICRNIYMALNETDRLKQFLGYFQFIERYTHSKYKTLNFDDDVKVFFNIPDHISEPASKFFGKIFSESKNLAQRFNWCAIVCWNHLDEDDITCFLEVKKVRDRISHGEHVEESELPVKKVEDLALKILGTK